MSEITITPFKKQYESEVVDLIISIQNDFGVDVTLEDQPDLLQIEEEYIHTGGNFWVALSENHVVGTIALVKLENGNGAIKKMFAAPAFRGEKQLGKKLLDTLISYCKDQGYKELYLGTVNVLIAAQKFYKKNGFVECSKADMPKDYHIMDVDNVFFKKTI
ncbi:GNAT family N-acetyltransferase [Candidatus Enterococcus ferrettii]|uniref:N-acetyltransferase domain-containing protein n=1 Tax=Candidatus Enterococcus ferrettii TaxID=2815324 RepID=A0ABV0ELA4_9ENTE|nr:GNAT family N-acetyltransferase [Enterococcus sp. 665A]MBO1338128.1 GNAT family N-acetyltransferase [Enterococcus sp. 665A]